MPMVLDECGVAFRRVVVLTRPAAGDEGIKPALGNIQADEGGVGVDNRGIHLFLAMRVHDSFSGSRFDQNRNRGPMLSDGLAGPRRRSVSPAPAHVGRPPRVRTSGVDMIPQAGWQGSHPPRVLSSDEL